MTDGAEFKKFVWTAGAISARPIGEIATWTVAGSAATIAVLIQSIEPVTKRISDTTYGWVMLLLLASLALGALCKALSTLAILGVDVNVEFERLEKTGNADKMFAHVEDFERLMEEIREPLPLPQRWIAKRAMAKGMKDPLHGFKRSARLASFAASAWYLHIAFFAFALGIVALKIIPPIHFCAST